MIKTYFIPVVVYFICLLINVICIVGASFLSFELIVVMIKHGWFDLSDKWTPLISICIGIVCGGQFAKILMLWINVEWPGSHSESDSEMNSDMIKNTDGSLTSFAWVEMKEIDKSQFIWNGSCWSFTLEKDNESIDEITLAVLGDEKSPFPDHFNLLKMVVSKIDTIFKEGVSYLDDLDRNHKASDEEPDIFSIRVFSSTNQFLLDLSFTYSTIAILFEDFKPIEHGYSENYHDDIDF